VLTTLNGTNSYVIDVDGDFPVGAGPVCVILEQHHSALRIFANGAECAYYRNYVGFLNRVRAAYSVTIGQYDYKAHTSGSSADNISYSAIALYKRLLTATEKLALYAFGPTFGGTCLYDTGDGTGSLLPPFYRGKPLRKQ
jgi:hypothetical protein